MIDPNKEPSRSTRPEARHPDRRGRGYQLRSRWDRLRDPGNDDAIRAIKLLCRASPTPSSRASTSRRLKAPTAARSVDDEQRVAAAQAEARRQALIESQREALVWPPAPAVRSRRRPAPRPRRPERPRRRARRRAPMPTWPPGPRPLPLRRLPLRPRRLRRLPLRRRRLRRSGSRCVPERPPPHLGPDGRRTTRTWPACRRCDRR